MEAPDHSGRMDYFDQFRKFRFLILPLLSLLFAGLAVLAAHLALTDVGPAEIRSALAAIRTGQIAVALLCVVLSFGALASFDVLAVQTAAPGQVSVARAAFAGILSHAIANLLGFGALTGGALRYRIYSAAGLDAADVMRIVANSSVTFWYGFVALLAIALMIDPGDVTTLRFLGVQLEIVLGAVLTAAIVTSVVWLGHGPRTLRIAGWTLPLPGRAVAIGQIVAGSIDLAASAGVLYALLPAEATPAFPYFIVLFSGAVLLGLISHAPGGFGVFEAVIIAGLEQTMNAEVIAGLIVYRLVYYVLPFAIAAGGLAIWESLRNKRRISAAAAQITPLVRPVIPVTAALIAFLSGVLLLFSAALPPTFERLQSIREQLPLVVVEGSHLIGSVIGVALLLVARGLLRRLSAAWLLTELLLLIGAAASVLKGLDWDDAAVLMAMAVILYVFRSAFYRGGPVAVTRLSPGWLAMALSASIAAGWLGFFSNRHLAYSQELWWQFAWSGNAPRFLRAMVIVSAVLVWAAVDLFLRRAFETAFEPDPVTETVRGLVTASTSTQTNVAYLGDKKFLVSRDGSGFLMYGRAGRSLITMGDPVGDKQAAIELIWGFRELADRSNRSAVHYAIGLDYLPVYLDMGLSILKIGEIARVDLGAFSLEGPGRREFRYADRRAAKDGLTFAVIPKAEVPRHMQELKRVSDAWLGMKSGHEKAFSLGFFSPPYLSHFDCAVMRQSGRIVAFANIWRSAELTEISVDLMRYLPNSSNVLMEALFARLLLYGKEAGYHWFNLGAAPLSGLADHPLASNWSRIGTLLYHHAEDFYRFEGLKAFKQKFDPVWTPQYLACSGGLAIPAAFIDVNRIISGGHLGIFLK